MRRKDDAIIKKDFSHLVEKAIKGDLGDKSETRGFIRQILLLVYSSLNDFNRFTLEV